MIRRGHNSCLVAGLVASAIGGGVVGVCVGVESAVAQTRPAASPQQRPFGTSVRPTRPGEDTPETSPETTMDQPVDIFDQAVEPGDEPPPRLRLGRRPIVDGDPNYPPEPRQPVDGVVDNNEPVEPVDGDPNGLDTRDPEDIAVFEQPAAGFDPNLFVAETEPILDRRPARLARFEPFQPVGVKMGSFIVLPEAEFAGAGYSNLFRSSSNVRSDVAIDFRPSVRVVSNWSRHALEFRATGLTTFHNQFPSEDDRAYLVESRGRIDLTRRANVEGLVSQERSQEVRGSINAATRIGERADIDTTRLAAAYNQRFNRLSIQIRGTLTDTSFSSVKDATGNILSNAFRDNVFKETAARATWAFKPTLGVFSEAVLNQRDYQQAPADGISRNSTGDRVRAGISFGTTSQIVQGEISAGYAQQHFEDSRLPAIAGGIFDANLAWRMTKLTSLLLVAKSDIVEATTLVGTGGGLSQAVGAELRHAFQRRLIGTAAAQYTKVDYQGITLHETNLTTGAGLEYYFNREVSMFGRYQHIDFGSTDLSRNYNADEVRVGMKVRL